MTELTLPPIDDLNAIVEMIAPNKLFIQLPPEQRLQIVTIYASLSIGDSLEALRAILMDIEVDTTKVGRWFEVSRVYEGH